MRRDQPPAHDRSGAARPAVLSPGIFVALTGELFLLCLALGIYVVFRATHPEVQRAALRFPPLPSGIAQVLMMMAACALSWMARRCLRNRQRPAAMILAGLTIICALVTLGLMGAGWAGRGGPRVILLMGNEAPARPPAAKVAPISKGDAKQGAKAFAASCAACHGPAAEGIAQVAPGLKDSEFARQANDATLARLIITGRTANDPASRTQKVMPPRGGNPFLSDGDVTHIVAYLRSVMGGQGAQAAGPKASAAMAPPHWVVPTAAEAPAGLGEDFKPRPQAFRLPPSLTNQQPSPEESTFAALAAMINAIQAAHLLAAVAITAGLLWQAYAARLRGGELPIARLAGWYWTAAVAIWAVLFPLLYVL